MTLVVILLSCLVVLLLINQVKIIKHIKFIQLRLRNIDVDYFFLKDELNTHREADQDKFATVFKEMDKAHSQDKNE